MSALTKMRYTRELQDALERELINHCVCHRTSYLCAAVLEEDHELKVHQSGGGWYIGVISDTGEPLSRDSEYFPLEVTAQEALDNRSWEQRLDA